MSAAVGAGSSPRKARFSGLLKPLHALAPAGVHSFDRLLSGMVAAGQGIDALCGYLRLTRAALHDHLVRLGLPTPHDRPLRKAGHHRWSVAETTLLIIWRLAGVHCKVIGRVLGRTVGAVRGKAWRTGVPAPERWLLHKPDPESLRDPEPGLGLNREPWRLLLSREASCGRAAGPSRVRTGSDSDAVRATTAVVALPGAPSPAPESVPTGTMATRAIPPAALPVPLSPPAGLPVVGRASAGGAAIPGEADWPGVASTPAETAQAPAPIMASRCRRGPFAQIARAAGQRELPLLDVVGGRAPGPKRDVATSPPIAPPSPQLPPIPRTVEEVDLSGDLTWFRRLKRRQTYEVAVYACGMLFFAGVHWKEVARRFGVSPATLRTFRSNVRVPVDPDRSKLRLEFNEKVARATREESGYVLRESMGPGDKGSGLRKWFWVHKRDLRSTHFASVRRRRESYEPRSNLMRIVIEAASGRAPPRSSGRPRFLHGGMTASP